MLFSVTSKTKHMNNQPCLNLIIYNVAVMYYEITIFNMMSFRDFKLLHSLISPLPAAGCQRAGIKTFSKKWRFYAFRRGPRSTIVDRRSNCIKSNPFLILPIWFLVSRLRLYYRYIGLQIRNTSTTIDGGDNARNRLWCLNTDCAVK